MKKIILLSDGTGNRAGKKNQTNVWRLYRALDLNTNDQIAMYSDGVGSKGFLLLKIIGGAFGWGLKRNVIELYKYLSRNYESGPSEEEADKIYLFGFSRGAFTVRVLAGLIFECGLLPPNLSEQELHKQARHKFSEYRYQINSCKFNLYLLFMWVFRILCRKQPTCTNNSKPKIEFIGVWDTVDAYGLPIDELKKLCSNLIFPLNLLANRELKCNVSKACHAISVDDERHTFHPVLWKERENDARIEQVWFPGVHGDVGGGYSNHELSLISLDWMISKVEKTDKESPGLEFITDIRQEYISRSDQNGIQHDSRAKFAAYYRYMPRFIENLCNDPKNGVKINFPKIHSSVFKRIKGNVLPYAPTVLPKNYVVVSTRGGVKQYENDGDRNKRIDAMNYALDIIFLRRWLYAIFVGISVLLVLSLCYTEYLKCPMCLEVFGWLKILTVDYVKGIFSKLF